MFNIWKKEVTMTLDLNVYQSAANALHDAHIKYWTKRVSHNARRTRGRYGSFGEDDAKSMTYYIYVKSSDYDAAIQAIGKCR